MADDNGLNSTRAILQRFKHAAREAEENLINENYQQAMAQFYDASQSADEMTERFLVLLMKTAPSDARGPVVCRSAGAERRFMRLKRVMSSHAADAAVFTADEDRMHWHDQALWFVRAKRDKAAQSVPEWETLRDAASQIKLHTIARLPEYLEQFEENARRLGAHVHWARDADDHNRIVLEILQNHGARKIVKSKSMLTEECHLNPFLEKHGIEMEP